MCLTIPFSTTGLNDGGVSSIASQTSPPATTGSGRRPKMDPLAAFSLFCNIITTVEVAVKTGRELKQLYESPSGLTGDKEQLQKSTSQLRKIATELNSTRRRLPTDSQQHPIFVEIAKECADVTDKIDAILSECQVGGRGPRRIAVVKAWVRSRKKQPELERLLAELQSTTQRLQTSIAAASQADLESLKDQVFRHGVQQSKLLDSLSCIQAGLAAQTDLLANMQQLSKAFEDAQDSIRHTAILRALKPPSSGVREDEIKGHHPETFSWILNQHHTGNQYKPYSTGKDFVEWLKEGSGVYHIAGKPGSGKSTLTKFLASEPAVRAHLEQWANSGGKQLILSKFFFWKYGADDQKSARGLLRGLLYDMTKDNPYVAKALFPKLWGDPKGWRLPATSEMSIKGSDIRTAFERLRTNEDIRQRFRLCLFIDGLDEFDGKEMSHSRLAKELQSWTEDTDLIKICLSSREEHPIMNAFPACRRIHLQTLTWGDISAMVTKTLEDNDTFLKLQRDNKEVSDVLVRSIVNDARGVFLWVALLLKLLEDELSSGTSSLAALQNIVRSTPSELEEFLTRILESINKHHQHGAHFILAMALRMIGIHLGEEGRFSTAEQTIHEERFKHSDGALSSWEPDLHLYGVGMVLKEFEMNNITVGHWSLSRRWVGTDEYRAEVLKAAQKVKSWCRGLLETPSEDEIKETEFRYDWFNTWFAHRSIPDFLASIMPSQARKSGFGDEDVACAILAVTTARIRSTEAIHLDFNYDETIRVNHVLRLLRLRQIPETSSIPDMLDELDSATFEVYQRCRPLWVEAQKSRWKTYKEEARHFPPPSMAVRGDQQLLYLPLKWGTAIALGPMRTDTDLPGLPGLDFKYPDPDFRTVLFGSTAAFVYACHAGLVEYVQWQLKRDLAFKHDKAKLYVSLYGLLVYFWAYRSWSDSHNSLLRLLLSAGSPFELRFPPNPRQEVEGKSALAALYSVNIIRKAISERETAPPTSNSQLWLWPIVLSRLLEYLVLGIPASRSLWDMLEVWLEHGAMPPLEVSLERVHTDGRQRAVYRRVESFDAGQCCESFAEWPDEPSIGTPGDGSPLGPLEEGYELYPWAQNPDSKPLAYLFFRMPVARDGPESSAIDIWYLRTALKLTKDNIGTLVSGLQSSNLLTFEELVRYHNPHNAKVIFRYTEQNRALLKESGYKSG